MRAERSQVDEPIRPQATASTMARNQSLVRGAQLLRALARRPEGATVADLARTVELPRTTVARLLATLEEIGFADRSGTAWMVGREITRLGQAADPFRRVIDSARPVLERLAIEAQASALLQIVNSNWDAGVLVQVDPPQLVGATNWVDRRFAGALHASASGKLALSGIADDEIRLRLPQTLPAYTDETITDIERLLAEIAHVRQRGYAETVDELEVGLTANAVPLDDAVLTRAVGLRSLSIGISGLTSRLPVDRRGALAAHMLELRDEIQRSLAGS
jgi:DNA-binding IclR family transcriptional regulator